MDQTWSTMVEPIWSGCWKKCETIAASEPAEIVFAESGQQQIRVIAHWNDGTHEDVTCLSRFQTNDDSIATVDNDGLATSSGPVIFGGRLLRQRSDRHSGAPTVRSFDLGSDQPIEDGSRTTSHRPDGK